MDEWDARLVRLWVLARGQAARDERGDVPGWVMITVMTVAIVAGIWGLADQQLREMLSNALAGFGPG